MESAEAADTPEPECKPVVARKGSDHISCSNRNNCTDHDCNFPHHHNSCRIFCSLHPSLIQSGLNNDLDG